MTMKVMEEYNGACFRLMGSAVLSISCFPESGARRKEPCDVPIAMRL